MTPETVNDETLVKLPIESPQPGREGTALMRRLVETFGASWVDEHNLAAWAAAGGDRVLLLAGHPVRFPEGQDVAAVLPELQRSFAGRFCIGVAPEDEEDRIGRRYGAQRRPTLLFLRDGGYVATVTGMHDWDVFLQRVEEALASPVTRAPTIGIPVVVANAGDASCH